jgi:hypothetical protein
MTEADWMTGSDPQAMLEYVQGFRGDPGYERHSQIAARKLRLFACACCRLVWDGRECQDCCALPEWADPELKARVDELMTGGFLGDGIGPGNTAKRINAEWGRSYTGEGIHAVWQRGKDWHIRACRTCHGTGRTGGLTDPRSRRAVKVAEAFADGEATEQEFEQARGGAVDCRVERIDDTGTPGSAWRFACVAASCCYPNPAAEVVSDLRQWPVDELPPAVQAALLRCIFGNPLAAPSLVWRDGKAYSLAGPIVAYPKPIKRGVCLVTSEATYEPCPWLSWNNGTVPKLARLIYDERRWDELPVLADALEEADCSDAAILGHLRGEGPHARGCWVLDLLLGL